QQHALPPVGATSERAAKWYLQKLAPLYQLPSAALSTVVTGYVHDTGRGGIIVEDLQKVDGIDVYHNALKVLMERDQTLVAITGNLHAAAVPGLSKLGKGFVVAPQQAILTAFEDLYGVALPVGSLIDTKTSKADYHYFDLNTALPAVKQTGRLFSDP